jgi:hypothetical protein
LIKPQILLHRSADVIRTAWLDTFILKIKTLGYESTTAVFSSESAFAAGRKSLSKIQIYCGRGGYDLDTDPRRTGNRRLLSRQVAILAAVNRKGVPSARPSIINQP